MDIASQQFPLPRHSHNFSSLKTLSWGQRADNLKVLNLVSMEDAVKLATWMKRFSPLSWRFCTVEYCHAERWHYRVVRFSVFSQLTFRPHERRFKRLSLCQWRRSENYSVKWLKETVNRILLRSLIRRCKLRLREMQTLLRRTSFILIYDTCSCVGN